MNITLATRHNFTGANCRDERAWEDDWHPNTSKGRAGGFARVQAVTLCSGCPHKQPCATEALDVPMVSGIWAGVFVPAASGRGRTDAIEALERIKAGERAPSVPYQKCLHGHEQSPENTYMSGKTMNCRICRTIRQAAYRARRKVSQ